MKFFFTSITLFCASIILGQDTTQIQSISAEDNRIKFSAYVETYYSYDFNRPLNNERPSFFYNHNRHNEFNLNLGFIKATVSDEKIRANLAIATGTYMNANYAAEPGVLKNVFEANAGFKIGKKNIWLDAGIFPSHIGWEGATGKDNWTLTRSIVAENSPYFEAGAKLTYTADNNKWIISGMVLNGFQRIKRLDGNSLMSFGTQLTYKPTIRTTLNYSTFIGTDKADSARQIRIYHDVYGIFQLTEKFGLTVGFDVATEQKSRNSSNVNTLYSPVLIARYAFSKKISITVRGEYYSDEYGIIIKTVAPNGFKTAGFSMNLDYAPDANMLFRIEGRTINSKNEIFTRVGQATNNNTFFTSSFAISF